MRDAMSTQKIIKELLDENLIGAKKEIQETLYQKLGQHLNEIYKEVAPEMISEGKKKNKKSYKKSDEKCKECGKKDCDCESKEGEKPDFLDLDGDKNKEEPMKDAAKDAKDKKK